MSAGSLPAKMVGSRELAGATREDKHQGKKSFSRQQGMHSKMVFRRNAGPEARAQRIKRTDNAGGKEMAYFR